MQHEVISEMPEVRADVVDSGCISCLVLT